MMLYIYLNDNRFKYEVEELIKIFVPPSSMKFVLEDTLENRQSLLLKIIVSDNNGLGCIQTQLIKEKAIIHSQESDHCCKITDKKTIKDCIKRFIYKILSVFYQYEPPWGILTGVRPTKIVNELMDNDVSEKEILHILKEDYFIKEEKISLLMEVCNNERKILKADTTDQVSIYIGIPFCPSRCIYCSFTSHKANEEQMKSYLLALEKEIAFTGEALKRLGIKLETIYIGGGTPTTLSERQLDDLLSWIATYFNLEYLKEYTIECGRPDTINKEKLNIIKKYGVHRISINPQSMREKTLIEIGRRHKPIEIIETFREAKKYGFDINMDLIAGLPGEQLDDFSYSLNAILSLNPENITIHTLALKKTSKLQQTREEYNYKSENNVKEMLRIASQKLRENKYMPYYMYRQKHMSGNYENVGYCHEGHLCIYNIRIMEEKQTIIALGAGGISKVYYPLENRLERVPNVSNYEIYIQRIDEMIERKRNLIFANIDNKIDNTL